MTVRDKSALLRALLGKVTSLQVYSLVSGELWLQVTVQKKVQTVALSGTDKRPVDLLQYASPSEWRASKTLVSAVSAGRVVVHIDGQPVHG